MRFMTFLLVSILSIIVLIRFLEQTSVFYPVKTLTANPQDIGLEFEELYIPTSDGIKIHGWFIPQNKASATLLFAHGNGGNISTRLAKIQLFHRLGLNVLIFDYRGYGLSEGRPTEQGIYKDMEAAMNVLLKRKDVNPQKIIAYGESLGGAPAIDIATRKPVAALVLDSTFSSARDMAKRIYPVVPSCLVSLKYENDKKIKTIHIPKLIIHSQSDEVIPYALGRKLFEAAAEPKVFLDINGDHNDGFADDHTNYVFGIREFLKAHQLLPVEHL
jgi:fermentation-respiration switch protein FrsA (DUF1100 family)